MPQKCPASPVSRQRGLPPHSAIAWAAKTTAMCCSKSWRLRSPKANCLQSQLLVSVLFLTCRHHIVTWWPGTELWSLPVLQEPYSHHAPMTASKPNSLQRPPRYHHIGIRASTCGVDGGGREYGGINDDGKNKIIQLLKLYPGIKSSSKATLF